VVRLVLAGRPVGGLYVTGGDVTVRVMAALGAHGIELEEEVLPLAVAGRLQGGPHSGLPGVAADDLPWGHRSRRLPAGRAVIAAIQAATRLALAGEVDAVVTAAVLYRGSTAVRPFPDRTPPVRADGRLAHRAGHPSRPSLRRPLPRRRSLDPESSQLNLKQEGWSRR
jgi:hypothetical protein